TGVLPLRLGREPVPVGVDVPRNILTVDGVGGVKPLPLGCRVAETDGAEPTDLDGRPPWVVGSLAKQFPELGLGDGIHADLEGLEVHAPAHLPARIVHHDGAGGDGRHLDVGHCDRYIGAMSVKREKWPWKATVT